MPTAEDSTVTVIIPAYNAERTLGLALESVQKQGVDCQIIVVDDGSRDRTADIARSFSPGVCVLTGPNQGPSGARNKGLEIAGGSWVVFLDADDALEDHTLSQRLETAGSSAADVVICDWEEESIGTNGAVAARRRRFDWDAFAHDAELATATVAWAQLGAMMFRTGLLKKIGGFKTHLRVAEDARLIFDCVRAGASFAYSEHVGAIYKYTPESQSRADKGRFYSNVFVKLNEIRREWEACGALTPERRRALGADLYGCERGLFEAGSPTYFEAWRVRSELRVGTPLHSLVAFPLARLIGLEPARRTLALMGKG